MASPHGKRRARATIDASHGGAESPGEAQLRWMVLQALAGRVPASEVESQREVIAGGRRYFLDSALPAHRIDVEFDGSGKILDVPTLSRERLQEERSRDEALRRAGWRPVHVTWDELRDPQSAMAKLVGDLRRLGVDARIPRGWEPTTPTPGRHALVL